MFKQVNINPSHKVVGDCVITALAIVLEKTWDAIYIDLCLYGFELKNWGSSNDVWNKYLIDNGFVRDIIPNTCPDCYTVIDFCKDNPIGRFILATGSHVIAVINGKYYDVTDSGNEVISYYYRKDKG